MHAIFCTYFVPFVPVERWNTFGKFLRKNGGDDGTRTRGLCRDSSRDRLYNHLQERRDCQNTRKTYKTPRIVGWRFAFPCSQEDQCFPNLDFC